MKNARDKESLVATLLLFMLALLIVGILYLNGRNLTLFNGEQSGPLEEIN